MRRVAIAVLMLLVVLPAPAARAGSVLDRVRSQGVIRCGGVSRPGLVAVRPDGVAAGLLLDLCRAIGAAVLGPSGRVEFNRYDSTRAYDAVRDGRDDVFFLSASEIIEETLAGKVVPGPTVFYETTSVMVAEASTARHLVDLAQVPVCFLMGSNAHRHLEAWFAARHLDFMRMGYQEDVEMVDAYNVQVCRGLAAEVTTLAEERLDGGVRGLQSRILPEPLAAFPIIAATGTGDPQWSSVVAWTVHTVVAAQTPPAEWAAGGVEALPIAAPELGLARDWQRRVVDVVGTYADMYRRNLGDGSVYRLPRGLNAAWQDGGLMLAPSAD